VGLSRATHDVQVFTDKKAELTKLIEKSTGEKMVALSKKQLKEREKIVKAACIVLTRQKQKRVTLL